MAWSTQIWFVGNAAALTALVLLVLRTLDFRAVAHGLLLAAEGGATVAGALLAQRIGDGASVSSTRSAYPIL